MFIQIAITSLLLYITIANYYWIREQDNAAAIAWGEKEYFKLAGTVNMSMEMRGALIFSKLTNSSGEFDPKYVELFENVESFYEKLLTIDGLTMMTGKTGAFFGLSQKKQRSDEDKTEGAHSMFSIDSLHEFKNLNMYYIDSEFLDFFNIKLIDGERFVEDDFLYENDMIPVLMGDSFRKYYTLGEEFSATDMSFKKKKFKVVGFIAKNQYYCPVKDAGTLTNVYSFDNIIL
jgi:hypothetical protein